MHRKDLAAFRTTIVQGVPTLDLVGQLVTVAEELDRHELHEVVAAALKKRLTTAPRLAARQAEFEGARQGIGDLRNIVRRYLDVRAEASALETKMLRLLHVAGLHPLVGTRSPSNGAGTGLDFAFVPEKVAIEGDGYEYHSSREAFDADRERRNALELAGWLVLNATSRGLDRLVPTVQSALALRRAQGDQKRAKGRRQSA